MRSMLRKGTSTNCSRIPRLQMLSKPAKLRTATFMKVSALIIDLTRMPHAFASGNRRTAFAVTMEFMKANGERLPVLTDARNVLSGIREGFYTKEDVKEWLKGNGIREFQRK